jgi:hypothetical protein
MRVWKVVTGISTVWIGYETVFRTQYDPYARTNEPRREHVFSDIQRRYNQAVDSFLGVSADEKSAQDASFALARSAAAPIRGVDGPTAPRKGIKFGDKPASD